MGVPSFFRWLHDNYPLSLHDYVEEAAELDEPWPPNPNGIEFDNFYLDFNQIVHNATHPSGRPAPVDRDAMVAAVCAAVDRLVAVVRPRKLLVIAFDGVAPRAKMNQQRARRYLAVKERENEVAAQAAVALTWGLEPPAEHFDHNAITPGTEFMADLGLRLREYAEITPRSRRDHGCLGLSARFGS
jgi:5'-3' exoribonuclease 2